MSAAFVLAGGGCIGTVQVGMLRELLAHGADRRTGGESD
jgi:predicted acylesterase/phospholipase RssA